MYRHTLGEAKKTVEYALNASSKHSVCKTEHDSET